MCNCGNNKISIDHVKYLNQIKKDRINKKYRKDKKDKKHKKHKKKDSKDKI